MVMVVTKAAQVEERRRQWRSLSLFTKHELLEEVYWNKGNGARWVIGEPGTSNGRTEIIAGIFGSLIVHGDFELCRFACYGDKSDAWSRLCWMADCRDLGYYVRQKASIGMSRAVPVDDYDEGVACVELCELASDVEFDNPELAAVLREAQAYAETREDLGRFLSDNERGWDLWEHNFGAVLSYRVTTAHAALNKCAWLLRERRGRWS